MALVVVLPEVAEPATAAPDDLPKSRFSAHFGRFYGDHYTARP
jgi:hypothetical protein